ncbi:hypothetical protein [Halovulum sp. GXIMD14793]
MGTPAQTSEKIWVYSYDPTGTSSFPKLIGISDGRLDGNGVPFDYATFAWDGAKAIRSEHFGGAERTSLSYTSDTTTQITNSLGKQSVVTFEEVEGRKRPISVEGIATPNCLGTTKSIDYTPNDAQAPQGMVYSRTHRNGTVTTYERDARGLIEKMTEDAGGADERVTTYTWHATLRLPLTRETSQMRETFTYDADGTMLTYTQEDILNGSPDFGEQRTTTYSYTTNAAGLKLLQSVDGPGLAADGVIDITTYTYDAQGHLQKVTDPVGNFTEILARDAFGNPSQVLDQRGHQWNFTYDVRGRMTNMLFRPGVHDWEWRYAYDAAGNMISMTNPRNFVWTYEYDGANRLISTTDPLQHKASYTNDAMGNVTQTTYAEGQTTTFMESSVFDELGRLTSTLGGAGQIHSFAYDLEDNLTTATDPANNNFINLYDRLNRLRGTVDQASHQTDLTLDDAGQTTAHTDPRAITTSFTYKA